MSAMAIKAEAIWLGPCSVDSYVSLKRFQLSFPHCFNYGNELSSRARATQESDASLAITTQAEQEGGAAVPQLG